VCARARVRACARARSRVCVRARMCACVCVWNVYNKEFNNLYSALVL